MDRIEELETLVLQARHTYYNPEPQYNADGDLLVPITDEQYDAWLDELAELKANSPAVTAIGAPPTSAWPKVSHGIPMGSLDKVQTLEGISEWIVKVSRKGLPYPDELFVTEKLDGISIHLRYEKGKLVQATTRGDGTTGEDITPNVLRMQGVVRTLPGKFAGSIRGEIVLHKDALATCFPGKTSTRNTAAGTAKRYDGTGCEHLTVYVYRIVEGLDVATEAEGFETLAKWGFKVPNWYVTAMTPGVRTPMDLWVSYQQQVRDSLPYDIDGLVVSINDMGHQTSLGWTDAGCPRGSVAFKFAAVSRETTIKTIEWQVGGTGRITPVAIFDPVSLIGAVVTRASLYNQAYITKLGVGVGAKVLVARANDVIPRVTRVLRAGPALERSPTTCPACGEPTWSEGEYLICQNRVCPAQVAGRIKLWIAEQGILEWGDTLIEKLTTSGRAQSVADIYMLTVEDLAGLDRMGDKSAKVVWDSLHARMELPLENILGGLAIPNIGTTTIRQVMDAGLDTWEKIRLASRDSFELVPGVGPAKAESLHSWINQWGQSSMLALQAAGVCIKERVKGNLTGKSFCFTGTMKHKRAELEARVTSNGGVVKTSVSKGLSFLVISDPNSSSTKAKTARKNGTTCISEEDFLAMVP